MILVRRNCPIRPAPEKSQNPADHWGPGMPTILVHLASRRVGGVGRSGAGASQQAFKATPWPRRRSPCSFACFPVSVANAISSAWCGDRRPMFGPTSANRSHADGNSPAGQFTMGLRRRTESSSSLQPSRQSSPGFAGGCGGMTSGWASLRLLVGLFAIVALALTPSTHSPAQDLDLLKQFLDTLKGSKDAKKLAKQRQSDPQAKARSRSPDEVGPISQDDYEGKVADLMSYMRSDALNDKTNPVRREAALIASVERHKQIPVPKRMQEWTCDISQIGVALDPFTDRANTQEPIGFHGGRGQGLFCEAKVPYLLVLD